MNIMSRIQALVMYTFTWEVDNCETFTYMCAKRSFLDFVHFYLGVINCVHFYSVAGSSHWYLGGRSIVYTFTCVCAKRS